jgi:class 3 adenylate cyclase
MLPCPSCGAEVPAGFAFCGRCGAPVGAGPGADERRVVTVLFCDLVGFTARADQADPEDVRALLRPYHARLRREVERFGGTLDKFIGDGAMAVFGTPATHEDDPERAVRCGLAILEGVHDLNRARPDLDLRVRVGINTGQVVVAVDRHHSEGVVGDVVNTAARLEGVAPVGGVLVGEPTFRATRGLFDYEPLPAVRVKGKAEPLAVWRAAATRSRLGVAVDQTPATPFLGRDIGDPQVVANVFATAALIEQAAGRPDAALGLVEELEVATRDGPGCYRADPLPTVARICAAAGRPELADAPAARCRHCLATAGAVLAEAAGDLEAAADRYDDAAAQWGGFGVVLEHGQALLGLGRCATRLGQPAGRDRLLRARGVFDRLGAPALLAETDRWLLEARTC